MESITYWVALWFVRYWGDLNKEVVRYWGDLNKEDLLEMHIHWFGNYSFSHEI